jgi:hypothetical protein
MLVAYSTTKFDSSHLWLQFPPVSLHLVHSYTFVLGEFLFLLRFRDYIAFEGRMIDEGWTGKEVWASDSGLCEVLSRQSGLRKTMKTLRKSTWYPGCDAKRVPPKYKCVSLTCRRICADPVVRLRLLNKWSVDRKLQLSEARDSGTGPYGITERYSELSLCLPN